VAMLVELLKFGAEAPLAEQLLLLVRQTALVLWNFALMVTVWAGIACLLLLAVPTLVQEDIAALLLLIVPLQLFVLQATSSVQTQLVAPETFLVVLQLISKPVLTLTSLIVVPQDLAPFRLTTAPLLWVAELTWSTVQQMEAVNKIALNVLISTIVMLLLRSDVAMVPVSQMLLNALLLWLASLDLLNVLMTAAHQR
jgi:hypothetical protein